jgi:hypothetical protein
MAKVRMELPDELSEDLRSILQWNASDFEFFKEALQLTEELVSPDDIAAVLSRKFDADTSKAITAIVLSGSAAKDIEGIDEQALLSALSSSLLNHGWTEEEIGIFGSFWACASGFLNSDTIEKISQEAISSVSSSRHIGHVGIEVFADPVFDTEITTLRRFQIHGSMEIRIISPGLPDELVSASLSVHQLKSMRKTLDKALKKIELLEDELQSAGLSVVGGHRENNSGQ